MQAITVGQFLRKQREERNIPLEFVSGVTRIGLGHLHALESDDFHLLAAEAYVRGYLRNYAKSIQINPDEVIAMYRNQVEAKMNQSPNNVPSPSPSHPLSRSIFKHLFKRIEHSVP
jgi:cytoskeletal protein RodZ